MRLIFENLADGDGPLLISEGEAAQLGQHIKLLNSDWHLGGDADFARLEALNELRSFLGLHSASGQVLLLRAQDGFDHDFVSEGVAMHHAGVGLRNDGLVWQQLIQLNVSLENHRDGDMLLSISDDVALGDHSLVVDVDQSDLHILSGAREPDALVLMVEDLTDLSG